MEYKKCCDCGEIKDIECFGMNRNAKDGRTYKCKECRTESDRIKRRAKGIPPLVEDVGEGKKRCPECREIKDIECFKVSKSRKSGRAIYCIECKLKKDRNYRISKGIVPRVEIEVEEGKKRCPRCKEIKAVEYFNRSKGTKSGYDSWCRKCLNERYHEKRREKGIVPRILGGGAEEGKKRCPTCGVIKDIDCFGKRFATADKLSSQCKECMRKYQIATKDRINKYHIERRARDENFRLAKNLRGRMGNVMKGRSKSASTMDLIGCTIEELWLHLECQFSEGMTRKNHGADGWHVDHIVPCANFDLTDPEQQRICFHYTNLQPLWATDNLRKNAKLPHELIGGIEWITPITANYAAK